MGGGNQCGPVRQGLFMVKTPGFEMGGSNRWQCSPVRQGLFMGK